MNTDTGELARIEQAYMLEALKKGFNPLTDTERKAAEAILGGMQSVTLPEGNPLRERVTKRVRKPATEKQMRAIHRIYKSMGGEAFWAWMRDNAPDILKDADITCGQAQRILRMLQNRVPTGDAVLPEE